MDPHNDSQAGDALTPNTPPQPSDDQSRQQRDTATNVIRSQIDALYGGGSTPDTTDTGPETTYNRTHSAHPQPQADQWKEYHSAWQEYYQKYYENYYAHQTAHHQPTGSHYFSHQPQEPEQSEEALTNDQALYELRSKLLGKVRSSADKVRRSRHFVPIIAAVLVVLAFVFVQYNSFFIGKVMAYVSPGSIDPQNIIVSPSASIKVSSEPRLIIPKINVDVPVLYDVGSDYDSQMAAMAKGVAHFSIPGASSHPGEVGNTAIAGHSSNDLFDNGQYKFIFSQLERMKKGDLIYFNYKGKRYTYVVTRTETVKPTDVNKLIYKTDKPVATLITCTPVGTALNRFLVTAEQISPDPSTAVAAPDTNDSNSEAPSIPGNSPTLFERLFGSNG